MAVLLFSFSNSAKTFAGRFKDFHLGKIANLLMGVSQMIAGRSNAGLVGINTLIGMTIPLAQAVGPRGEVMAMDIQSIMLRRTQEKMLYMDNQIIHRLVPD